MVLFVIINTFHGSTARKKFKVKVSESTHWYFTIIVKQLFFKTSYKNHWFMLELCFCLKKYILSSLMNNE